MILTGEIWLETWHLESKNELEDYMQQTRFSRNQLITCKKLITNKHVYFL